MAGRCMPELRIVIAVALLGLLAGCGQKGPLYLPDQARNIVTRPSGSSAPPGQSQAPNTPQSPDSSAQPPNPAPEVTQPEVTQPENETTEDKDKKQPGTNTPR